MRSLVLCYSPEDEAFARLLGDYLALNLAIDVAYGEGMVRPDFDLIDCAEQALSADVALVLLSPRSVPAVWSRPRWEPVFFQKPAEFGALLGFVQVEECKFPDLLRKQGRFFDACGGGWLREARRIRRWLLRPDLPVSRESSPDGLGSVLDAPGIAAEVPYAEAMAFGRAAEKDFEAVYSFDCVRRSPAGIAGDIGSALGVRLPGTGEESWAVLRAPCAGRRELFVFANVADADRLHVEFGGLSSVIFCCDAPERERATADEIDAVFFASPRDEVKCAALLGDAVSRMTDRLEFDFDTGLRLGWSIVSVLKDAERFAEAVEVLESMEEVVRSRKRFMLLPRIKWDLSWLRGTWSSEDKPCMPATGPEAEQYTLFG